MGGMVRIWARVEENPMPLMIVGRKVLKDTPGIAELKKRKEISASIVVMWPIASWETHNKNIDM